MFVETKKFANILYAILQIVWVEHNLIGKITFGTILGAAPAPLLGAPKLLRVDLDSIPHLQSSNDNRCIFEDLHLHPGVDDNREEADTEYVQELEELKQPHLGLRQN